MIIRQGGREVNFLGVALRATEGRVAVTSPPWRAAHRHGQHHAGPRPPEAQAGGALAASGAPGHGLRGRAAPLGTAFERDLLGQAAAGARLPGPLARLPEVPTRVSIDPRR